MEQQNTRDDVVRIVRRLGFLFSYQGTSCLVDAVMLCIQDPEALTAVTKRVYPAIAKAKGTKWRSVERNLRTTLDVFWERGNREFLNELAGYELRVRPSVAEVINYITGYIWEQELLKR